MKTLFAALLATATLAAPAYADPIVQTATITAGAPTSKVVTFNQFDSLLGTLNSITLQFVSSLTASGTFRNPANAPATRNFRLDTGATAALGGNGFNLTQNLGVSTVTITVPRQTTVNVGPFTGSGSATQTLTSGFAPFIGTGTTDLSFLSTSLFRAVPAGGQLSIVPQIGGTATLTYDYTAAVISTVPEPASWALMIAGFGAVGGAMRHRRRSAPRVRFV